MKETTVSSDTRNTIKELLNELVVFPVSQDLKKEIGGLSKEFNTVADPTNSLLEKLKPLNGKISNIEAISKKIEPSIEEVNENIEDQLIDQSDDIQRKIQNLEKELKKELEKDNRNVESLISSGLDSQKRTEELLSEIVNEYTNNNTRVINELGVILNNSKENEIKVNNILERVSDDNIVTQISEISGELKVLHEEYSCIKNEINNVEIKLVNNNKLICIMMISNFVLFMIISCIVIFT